MAGVEEGRDNYEGGAAGEMLTLLGLISHTRNYHKQTDQDSRYG